MSSRIFKAWFGFSAGLLLLLSPASFATPDSLGPAPSAALSPCSFTSLSEGQPAALFAAADLNTDARLDALTPEDEETDPADPTPHARITFSGWCSFRTVSERSSGFRACILTHRPLRC